jgi:hypothetical protein
MSWGGNMCHHTSENDNYIKGKPEGKRSLQGTRHKKDDSVKIDLK